MKRKFHTWAINCIEILKTNPAKEKILKCYFITKKDVVLTKYVSGFLIDEIKKEFADLFVDCRILTFEAIRRVFGLKKGEGTEKNYQMFWNTALLPEELKAAINDFGLNFEYFMINFESDQLAYMIQMAPDIWKQRAWKALKEKMSRMPFENGKLCPKTRILAGILERTFLSKAVGSRCVLNNNLKNDISEAILKFRLDDIKDRYFSIARTSAFPDRKRLKEAVFSLSKLDVITKGFEEMAGHLKIQDPKKPSYEEKKRSGNFLRLKDLWDMDVISRIYDDTHDMRKKNEKMNYIYEIIGMMV